MHSVEYKNVKYKLRKKIYHDITGKKIQNKKDIAKFRFCAYCKKINFNGTFAKCSRCCIVVYCTKKCQKKDWKHKHRNECSK